VNQAE